jgi:hypothetical protein
MRITKHPAIPASTEVEININDYVYVKLKPKGHAIYIDHYANSIFPARRKEVDADGWSEFQLYDLINIFGPFLWLGNETPFETTIKFKEIQ